MAVGMNELFRAAAADSAGDRPTSQYLSNVALLWAVKGPSFNLKTALEASGVGSAGSLADDWSLQQLVRVESDNVRTV